MNQLRFYLNLSAERYLNYQVSARAVLVRCVDGPRMAFPAEHLRRFVTHDGVQGEFVLRLDSNNKFLGLERIGGLPDSA